MDAFGEYQAIEAAHPELPPGRVQFDVRASPAAGSGFGGEGVAATGTVLLGVRRGLDGPPFVGIPTVNRGTVDTIASCGRTSGRLGAVVRGTLESGGRFEVSLSDGGPNGPDAVSITFPGAAPLGTDAILGGDVAIVAPDPCTAF